MCQLAGLILCLSGAVLVAPSELLPNPGFEARAAGEDLPDSWTVIEGHVGLTTQTVHSFLNPVQVADASSAKAAAWEETHVEAIAPSGASGVVVRLSAVPGSSETNGHEAHAVFVDDLNLTRIPREGPEVVDIGTERQLFIDDYIVDEDVLRHIPGDRPGRGATTLCPRNVPRWTALGKTQTGRGRLQGLKGQQPALGLRLPALRPGILGLQQRHP
jgi:hypothetical protein